jgi:uroporphyrinogen-III decarboxylase
MSVVVDRWVARLKGQLTPVGEMTHWQRLAAAFDLKQTDLIPVAPELDYWQITYAGYSHAQIYNDVDKTTDACLKTWADLRTDAIWMYVDISHQIEHFIPPERRPEYFVHRGEKDYLLFKPIATTLDEAIALYEQRTYERYLDGSRPVTHYTPHMLQLLEFQEKMDRQIPIIIGIATPTNYAETIVEVQRFLRWMVTEPEERVRHYLDLCLQERLAALDYYAEYAAGNGAAFCCAWGGARTWGPQHLEKFGDVDRIFIEKARQIFPYIFWHICGHNLWQALEMVSSWDGIKGIQYDMPYYGQEASWPEWFEQVARLLKGRQCAMNSPTTQLACHGTPQQIRRMVTEFIEATTPHTTACVMPGCEIDSFAPTENVQAIIDAARAWRPT